MVRDLNRVSKMVSMLEPKDIIYKDVIEQMYKTLNDSAVGFNIGNNNDCGLFAQFLIRRYAGSINSLMLRYKVSYADMVDYYNLDNIRKPFSCLGINVSDFIDVGYNPPNSTYKVLATKDYDAIEGTDANGNKFYMIVT